jgi:hypothetical protein
MASYLLTDIPPDLRSALSAVAAEKNRSIAEIVRFALAVHYEIGLRPRAQRSYMPGHDHGAGQLVIRGEAELFTAVRKEAQERDTTMRQVIIDILTDRYLVGI